MINFGHLSSRWQVVKYTHATSPPPSVNSATYPHNDGDGDHDDDYEKEPQNILL